MGQGTNLHPLAEATFYLKKYVPHAYKLFYSLLYFAVHYTILRMHDTKTCLKLDETEMSLLKELERWHQLQSYKYFE